MSEDTRAKIKVFCSLLLACYLIGTLYMLGPHILKTIIGGTRYVRLSPYEQEFSVVERSWWFGETKTYRIKRVSNQEVDDMMNWVARLEKKGNRNIPETSKEGEWSDCIYNDDDGALTFYTWSLPSTSED